MLGVGDRVEALDRVGTWREARILEVEGRGPSRLYRVHFVGWNTRFNESVLEANVRAAGPEEYAAGDRVEALDRVGLWKDARIVSVNGRGNSRRYVVHFMGWAQPFNESVAETHLRRPGEGTEPALEEM